ncbi:MAG: ammonia channel protein, partial [Propionibacteriaceae bacterium]|nr:ammonia channel protein [Propionibacteriaceae bacterium]
DPASPAGVAGLFYGGGVDQLWRQIVGALAVLVFSFVVTFILAKILDATMGLRVPADAEAEGIDTRVHAESGYDLNPFGGRTGKGGLAQAGIGSSTPAESPESESLNPEGSIK